MQEVYAGAAYYGCDIAMVITNSTFSKSAVELASRLNVILQENIDAILIYQSNEQLTQEEKEALKLEKIEQLLQEKYRSLRLKFPKTKSNDNEISSYIEKIQYKMKSYQEDDQRWAKDHREKRRDVEIRKKEDNWELNRSLAERRKQEKRRKKELLDQVNYDIGKFMNAGFSETSAKKLIALFRKVYTYAGSPDTIKYYRMKDKWKTLEESLPSIAEKRDKEAEKLAVQSARKKLTSVENEIRQLRTALKNDHIYNEKLKVLSDLQQELSKINLKKEKDIDLFLEQRKSFLKQNGNLDLASGENTKSYLSSTEDLKMKFDSEMAETGKRIESLKKKIDQYKKDIKKENPEKKQKRLHQLEKMLPTLQQEAKNARKNYLFKTYRDL